MQLCNNKRGKRLYPDMPIKPTSVQSVPILHNPHQLTETFSTMSVNSKYDIPLIGQTPAVEDFQLPTQLPNIPASVK